MQPLQAGEDLGAIAMKVHSAFLKASALLKPHHQIVCVISGYSVGEPWSSAEMQSVYSAVQPTGPHISKIKVATLVEGDPKAPFSIATTPRCRGGYNFIPWIAPLYLWSISYSAECEVRRDQVPFFESLVWLDLGLNSGLPDHWRTLVYKQMFLDKQKCIFKKCIGNIENIVMITS